MTDLVRVASLYNFSEVLVVRSMLEAAGCYVFFPGEQSVAPGPRPSGALDLYVPSAQAELACAVIEDFRSGRNDD